MFYKTCFSVYLRIFLMFFKNFNHINFNQFITKNLTLTIATSSECNETQYATIDEDRTQICTQGKKTVFL